ncbi:uncharacterized protein TRIVIDRAFT_200858 [Trichoderma virens Gv29-8]|uniref:Protein kinase domain-containing protein n=1 Tax=Hypocrea virens (strain Gv29-8 / FGSC 10586) TaxID=413071 RepID=G9MR29_HYPVG|nr:uncharacterized protein TRIVIDRAFT_200858 [Trichoderma virens Gv29-8]EHK22556.1 hypothetical protein TRIVIDRAFT_200858 [Trichoderma virens Gv29-8]
MEANANILPNDILFATFSAANDAAILLFELIQAKASPPNLVSDGNSIGFELSLPVTSDHHDSSGSDTGSETSSDTGLGSDRLEWKIGAGASPAMVDKGLVQNNPQIVLCPPGTSPASQAVRKYIKDFHASIYVHAKSGVLMLKAICDRPMIYEQGDMHDNDLELGLGKWGDGISCVLRREKNYINIGPYRFLLKYATQSRKTYHSFTAHINDCVKSAYHGLVPSSLFNFIPMASPYNKTRWNVWLHQQIPTTDVTTGVNIYTGQPVAIKMLRNRDLIHARQRIVNLLQMALHNQNKQDSGILGIIDVWCDHQTSPPCLFDAPGNHPLTECRCIYYSMPLASYNFLNLPWSKLAADMRLLYLHQTLLGLAELHGQGLVHGNIRPGSLLILGDTTRKLRLNTKTLATQKVVLSLSMSQIDKKMFHRTSICVAPEVWQNGGATAELDRTKLDIWALASSWLYAFATPKHGNIVTSDTHRRLQGHLGKISEVYHHLAPFTALLRKMLAWDPQDRPTVTEALASDAWQLVWTEKQKDEDKKKQKRKAKMQSDGAKRVRVLSPQEQDYRVFEP